MRLRLLSRTISRTFSRSVRWLSPWDEPRRETDGDVAVAWSAVASSPWNEPWRETDGDVAVGTITLSGSAAASALLKPLADFAADGVVGVDRITLDVWETLDGSMCSAAGAAFMHNTGDGSSSASGGGGSMD